MESACAAADVVPESIYHLPWATGEEFLLHRLFRTVSMAVFVWRRILSLPAVKGEEVAGSAGRSADTALRICRKAFFGDLSDSSTGNLWSFSVVLLFLKVVYFKKI